MGVFAPLNSARSGAAAVATDSSLSPLGPRFSGFPLVQSIAYRHRDRLAGIIAIPARDQSAAVHRRRQRFREEKETGLQAPLASPPPAGGKIRFERTGRSSWNYYAPTVSVPL